NIQRYIIWGMLAAVAYLMLIQWEKDYGKASYTQEIKTTNKEHTQQVQTNTIDQKSDDLPSVKIEQQDVNEESHNKTTTPKQINIKSKTLNLTIDLIGGDIVKAELLKHSVDIERPEIPVKILQNDIERSYVAQSGIVGVDGPDAKKTGRPHYLSEKNHY